MTEENVLLNDALKLAAIGWPVHPLHNPIFEGDSVRCTCRAGAECESTGKHPRLTGWQGKATTDEAQIRAWWTKWPEANIGVPCGPEPGLVLLDIDSESAKNEIEAYADKHSITTAKDDLSTTTAKTGNGWHLIFGWTDECEQLSNIVGVVEGLDIRTDGGQFVAPPSHHPSGIYYTWLKSPWDVPPKPLPGWLLTFITESSTTAKHKATFAKNAAKLERMAADSKKKRAVRNKHDGSREMAYAEAALAKEIKSVMEAREGTRNKQLNSSAFALGRFVGAGILGTGMVEGELKAAAMGVGLKPDEIRKTIASGLDDGEKMPFSMPEDEQTTGVSVSELDKITTRIAGDQKGQVISLSCGGPKQSTATRLVDLVLSSGAELWHSPEGDPFITIQVNDHREHHPTKNKTVRRWMSQILHTAEGKTPAGQSVRDALNVIEGMASFDGNEYLTFVRVAEHNDEIYIDMGNDGWDGIRISPKGWEIVPSEKVPVRFRRPNGLLPLPKPVRGGDLNDLRSLVNLPQGDPWILTVAWLLQAFRPTGPYPILVPVGGQGSGKSGLGRTLKSLVDPNVAALRRPPQNEKDLMIAATNSWAICYDNLSTLPQWMSDAMCVLSTGGGMASRALYTDSEEVLLDATRPVMMNGIDDVSMRGDLLDRALVIHMPRIRDTNRRTEKELATRLDELRPALLGALLDAVVSGLRRLPNVHMKTLPRMADFAMWMVACEDALPWENGSFIKAYDNSQSDAISAIIEGDTFALAVYNFALKMERPYEGSATVVLEALAGYANIDPHYLPIGWPRSPKGLTSKLKRLAPGLRIMGIGVEFLPRTENLRPIRLWKIKNADDDGRTVPSLQKTIAGGPRHDGK